MKRLRVVLTGANGQLGQAISQVAKERFPEIELLPLGEADLDVRVQGALQDILSRKPSYLPTILVNCAAYTAVDQAEDDDDEAYAVNSYAPGYLALSCSLMDMMMIHISTDYVFDGIATTPYLEDSPKSASNVYGQTKAVGEENVQRFLGLRGLIVRTSWLYSQTANNFVMKMCQLSRERDKLSVVSDQIGSPTYAPHLADAILRISLLAQERGYFPCPITHYSNRGACSWYDLAREAILLMGNRQCELEPITTDMYPTKAKRPAYSVLSLAGLQKHFDITPPTWQEGLRDLQETLRDQDR